MELSVGVLFFLVIVLVVLVAVVFALVVWQVLQIGWAFWTYNCDVRRVDIGRKYDCELCTFTRDLHSWQGELDHAGTRLRITVRDDGGVPDKQFIHRVPTIVPQLEKLERIAREGVPEITDQYAFDSILSPIRSEDTYEFDLGFSYDEEFYGMSIYVHFIGESVVGWMGVD